MPPLYISFLQFLYPRWKPVFWGLVQDIFSVRTDENKEGNGPHNGGSHRKNSIFPAEAAFTFPGKHDILHIATDFLISLHKGLRLNLCSFAVATYTRQGTITLHQKGYTHKPCEVATYPRQGTMTLHEIGKIQSQLLVATYPRQGTITCKDFLVYFMVFSRNLHPVRGQ